MKLNKETMSYLSIVVGLVFWVGGSFAWDVFAAGLPVDGFSLNEMASAPNQALCLAGLFGMGFAPLFFLAAMLRDNTPGKSMGPTWLAMATLGAILAGHIWATGTWTSVFVGLGFLAFTLLPVVIRRALTPANYSR